MYLIDKTYFTQELMIPQVSEEQIYETDNVNSFDAYIDRYVIELLQNTLGLTIFNELNSHITNGNLNTTAPLKFNELVNGAVITVDGKSYHWKGLLIQNGLHKQSLLANYVYCNWLVNNTSTVTGVGEVKKNAVNTTNINSDARIIKIWNEFILQYQGFKSINHHPNISIHKGVQFVDYYKGNDYDLNLTLVDYLRLSENFKEVNPVLFEVKNYFGL